MDTKGGNQFDTSWASESVAFRCRQVAKVAGELARSADPLIDLCRSDWRVDPVETVTAELFPLCAALKWIGRSGPKTLRDREFGALGRPAWLWGIDSRVRRVPLGRALILAAWNYPLFLPGVQVAQGLAAGNQMIVKPAPGCEAATKAWVDCFYRAGIPEDALQLIASDTQAAIDTIDSGVDLIVLTGAASTGRKVMEQAAKTLTPTIMELSGCDAVIVHPDADIRKTVSAIEFGMKFNSGATCIAPRRILSTDATIDQIRDTLAFRLGDSDEYQVHPSARAAVAEAIERTISDGASSVVHPFDSARLIDDGLMKPTLLDQVQPHHPSACSDLFAPVSSLIRVRDIEQAIQIVNQSDYRLAAAVFAPNDQADTICESISQRLHVGSVAVNDLIVPTADPRVPFGGRGQSGFGVTRGAEGLIAMTAPQVIGHRYGSFLPHLRPRKPADLQTLTSALCATYGHTLKERFAAIARMTKGG